MPVLGAGEFKVQDHAIDTPALAGWRRAVLEHMPHMQTTRGAMTFCPGIDQLEIRFGFNRTFADRLPIARPASSRLELVFRRKEREFAAYTYVGAGFFIVPILSGKGALSAFLTGNAVGRLVEAIAPFFIRDGFPIESWFGVGIGTIRSFGFGHGFVEVRCCFCG